MKEKLFLALKGLGKVANVLSIVSKAGLEILAFI